MILNKEVIRVIPWVGVLRIHLRRAPMKEIRKEWKIFFAPHHLCITDEY
jgi:hypothetical protein